MPLEIDDVWLDWQVEVNEHPAKRKAISGGLAAGKTNLIPKLIVDQSDRWPGVRGALAMPNYEMLEDSCHKEIEAYFSAKRIKAHFNTSENRWYLWNGSTLEYETFTKDENSLKGPEYGYGIIDEGDNKVITRTKYEIFDGRIGRARQSYGSGQLFVMLNPVSHGHWAYQDFRERGDADYKLFEISTYQNRYFLTEDYIRKQERKYPPGTAGHDRWMLGLCGIPKERAVYKNFKYKRDRITIPGVRDAGGLRNFRSALHLADGQPVGWLQAGFTEDGFMVPIRERKFTGDAARTIATVLAKLRQPRNLMGDPELTGVLPARFNAFRTRETGAPLADRSHKLFLMLCTAGLSLSSAAADLSEGIGKTRNRIEAGKLKLLVLEDGTCATPELLTELEEHEFSEAGKLIEEQWSLVRPLEFLCVANAVATKAAQRAGASLHEALNLPAHKLIDTAGRVF